jgi:hypothetical protein
VAELIDEPRFVVEALEELSDDEVVKRLRELTKKLRELGPLMGLSLYTVVEEVADDKEAAVTLLQQISDGTFSDRSRFDRSEHFAWKDSDLEFHDQDDE